MISIEQFLTLLENKELLSPREVAKIRERIAHAATPFTAQTLAKQLTKHGYITLSQAQRLLGVEADKATAKSAATVSSKKPAAPKPPTENDKEGIGLAPLDDEPAEKPKPAKKQIVATKPPAKNDEEELGLAPLDDEPTEKPKRAIKPFEKKIVAPPVVQSAKKPIGKPAPARPEKKSATSSGSLLDEELSAAGEVQGRLLDGLMADAATADAAPSPLAFSQAKGPDPGRSFQRQPKAAKKKTEEEKWGSSLMLVGGGGLLVLLGVCALIIVSLTHGGADKILEAANADYRDGSYPAAIDKYKSYLEKYASQPGASLVRVRIGLCQLRLAVSGNNWPAALETAGKVIGGISSENDFKEAHPELADMLPKIAAELTADAKKDTDAKRADDARQALALIDKYVPKDLQPTSKLEEIKASLAIAASGIARDGELRNTIAAMRKAVEDKKTAEAYSVCNGLLRRYPELRDDRQLRKTLLEVSAAQLELVKMVSEPRPAAVGEAETAVLRSFVPVRCDVKERAADADGQIVPVAVDGAVYGIDAVAGRVLWRRFVGFDENPRAAAFPPTPFSSEPGSDVLAVAPARNELLRLEGASGKIRWRCTIGEPFDAAPALADDKILVATRAGKLFTVAAASGKSSGYIQFPQELTVAPAVDLRRSLAYQIASHTNLFVVSLDDGQCKHVAYLGHSPASVSVAPIVVDDYLLAAVNDGVRDTELRVFAIQPNPADKTAPWLKPLQRISLSGHIQTPLLVDGRRVLVATGAGVVRVFEFSVTDAKTPLQEIGETAIEGGGNLVRYAAMQGGQFWIADNRLTRYDVQAARGQLSPQWVNNRGCIFLQPPAVVGRAVVSIYRKPNMPGATVSAVDVEKNDTCWETRLASPLAGEPLHSLDGANRDTADTLLALTAAGDVFRIDVEQTTAVCEPFVSADAYHISQPLGRLVELPGGLFAVRGRSGGDQIGVFGAKAALPTIQWLRLPDSRAKLACSPIAFHGGLLAPCTNGQVFLLDPKSGDLLAEPFQPRLKPGEEVAWTTPTVIDVKRGVAEQAILSDGKSRVYCLAVQDQPKPHLASLAETAVSTPIALPPAVLGESVLACDTAGGLTVFTLPSLAVAKEQVIGGRCAWGPARVGDNVVLATDADQLLCFDAKGGQLWRVKLEFGPLAGAPLHVRNHFLLASCSGIVWLVDAADGKTLGKVNVGCPLGAGPVLCGRSQKLLVAGLDGVLYEIPQPESRQP
jgi:outer membrane protein assembly factor BamB